jgi:hypothetical protein
MIRGSTKREHSHIAMSATARLASALDARLAKATAMASHAPVALRPVNFGNENRTLFVWADDETTRRLRRSNAIDL